MYKPPPLCKNPPCFWYKQAKIFWEKLIKEGGLDKQKTQASNRFGKEGGLEFFVYKGKMSSRFQR